MKLSYLLIILILPGLHQISQAQSICVGEEFKLHHAKGVVLEQTGFPIKDAILELHEKEFTGRIVQTVRSDAHGYFEFSPRYSGKFVLVANANGFIRITTLLKLKASRQVKRIGKRLVIILGAYPDEPCGGGEIRLEKEKPSA